MTPKDESPDGAGALYDEQRQLLELIGRGLSVTEAGRRLNLSTRTTERRLAEARAALGAATTAEAVLCAQGRQIGGRTDGLTVRERQVLELVGAGSRDEEIASRLGIAPSTVATLLRSSMAKLDARTRVEAVARLVGIQDERSVADSLVSPQARSFEGNGSAESVGVSRKAAVRSKRPLTG
jgi:DNA-binding NarL/FixJ family response regulator